MSISKQQIESIEAEADQNGVRRRYDELVESGESPRMAIMIAMQSFPGTKGTDATFNKLERERMADIDDGDLDRMVSIARSAGINTTGKTYNGQLGKYDDPAAWVSGTHDVRESCKKNKLGVRGQVNCDYSEKEPKKKKPGLAKPIVDRIESQYRQRDPSLNEKCAKKPTARKALREKIVAKHGSK